MTKTKLLISGWLIFCLAEIGALWSVGWADEVKTLTAYRTEKPPRIDGRLTEPEWSKAEKTIGFSNLSQPLVMAKDQTIGRVMFDDQNLYIGVECLESRMDLLKKALATMGKGFDYGTGEVIEIFLDPACSQREYAQIMVGVNGAVFFNSNDSLQVGQPPVKAGVSLGADRFFVEVAIPLSILHLNPNTKTLWGFNLNRARPIEKDTAKGPNDNFYSSWQNTGGAFNRPQRFGQLKISLDSSAYWYQVKILSAPPDTLEKAEFEITNDTGRNSKLKAVLNFTSVSGSKKAAYRNNLLVNHGEKGRLSFPGLFPEWTKDARLTLVITDAKSNQTVYYSITRSVDVTPKDTKSPPAYASKDIKKGYLLFSKDYNNITLRTYKPTLPEVNHPLEIYASPGEYEPCLLGVRTWKKLKGVSLRVTDDLTAPSGNRISRDNLDLSIITETKFWYTLPYKGRGEEFRWQPMLAEKKLPEELSANRTYSYWLTLKVPEDALPGTYRTEVEFGASGVPSMRIPLEVTVWPIKLTQPDDMCWGYYYDVPRLPPYARTLEYQKKLFQNLHAYGMNNTTIYGGVSVDGKIDQCPDPYLPLYQTMQDGLETGAITRNIPVMTLGTPILSKTVEEARTKNNWPLLLYYAYDEPGDEERIAVAKKGLTELKKNHPGVLTVTAISENGLKALGDLYDVWVVGAGDMGSPVIEEGKKKGKLIWMYDCGNHVCNPVQNRYFNGLYSWKTGTKGTWQWALVDRQFTHRTSRPFAEVFAKAPDELWSFYFDHTDDFNYTFNYVFPAVDGPIPSLGHIGRREGVDDYRYIYTLKRLIEKSTDNSNPAVRKASEDATDFLKSVSEKISLNPWREEVYPYQELIKQNLVIELGDWLPDNQIKPEDYNKIRREIARQIIKLQVLLEKGKR